MMARILAVDPGEQRIGLAISDPEGLIARPLQILIHRTREDDARAILSIAEEQKAEKIIIGLPLNEQGKVGPQAQKSLRLVRALRAITHMPVIAWDERGSTQAAERLPSPHAELDARAAAVILQDYLDAQGL